MIPIYIINFHNDERKQRMISRFKTFNIEPIFVNEIGIDDNRLNQDITRNRVCAIMLQHLDAIKHFYDHTNASHCIVCEDDIHISKDFADKIKIIEHKFDQLQLDVLLLGYLLPYKIDMNSSLHQKYYTVIGHIPDSVFHRYPDDLWGCQMYMISRKYAKYLLDTYTVQYAIEHKILDHYNPDWIITKNGQRAIIYPMLAVEEGINNSNDDYQVDYHRRCFVMNYDSSRYI